MKAHLKELSHQLLGTVTDNPAALGHFSTDASIFQAVPAAAIYPQNTADVRKAVQFVAGRAASGKPDNLVPRGYGAGFSGGSVGEGIQMVFPAHMNKLLRLDHETVAVQPGISYGALQQTLYTHSRFLPSHPAGLDYSSVGGAVAGDVAGEKSLKYGTTRDAIKGLKVVLADGSLIKAHRITARELSRKKGLSTLEGEVYRKLDSLILDHAGLISRHMPKGVHNTAGYALDRVRGKDGSFDLSQIFIGSEGTLGLITEVTLKTARFNPRTTLVVGYLQTISSLDEILHKLRALKPSALEFVDGALIAESLATRPGDLAGLVPDKAPRAVLLVEFDDFSQIKQKLQSNRAARIFARHGASTRTATDPLEQVALWKLRYATAAAALWMQPGSKQALPFVDGAVVPAGKLGEFLDKTAKLLKKYELESAVWGSAGTGHMRLYPRLNLARNKDADRLIHLAREFYEMVVALGGAVSGGQGDGLLRGPFLQSQYGEELMEVMASVKHIFDPNSIFNPHKKTQSTEAYLKSHLRNEYSLNQLMDHVVHT